MNAAILDKAIELAEKTGHLLVATADPQGLPHVGVARKLCKCGSDHLAVRAWFCPGTVRNAERSCKVSLVIWDRQSDEGYQLLGDIEGVEKLGILDGYVGEQAPSTPQVERQLTVHVCEIMRFSHAPHTDVVE